MSTDLKISPIKAYRLARNLRQEDLGAMFNPPFAKSSIHRWETEGVPLERVLDIEKVTGIPRAELAPQFFAVSELKRAAGQ
jgi:hypothetical protein